MTSLFITWNPDPQIINIGGFGIRWYGLLFALGFVFGYIIIKKIFTIENIPMKILDSLTMYMILGTVIGARLGHCFFYEAGYYIANPIEIFYLRQGGLASHGAALGILIALYLFSRKHKKPFLWIVDRIVIVVALAGVCIRLGNFMNSEIIGSPSDLPWAFVFEQVDKLPRHPTQLYESIACLMTFFLLAFMYHKHRAGEKNGLLFGTFLVAIFGFRFFVEFFKDVQVDFEQGMTLNMGQWLSIPFVLAGIGFIFYANHMSKKTNG